MVRPPDDVLAMATSDNIRVPPEKPYEWDDGSGDIELIMANAPIIAMAWVHEGTDPPQADPRALSNAKTAAEADDASEDILEAYEQERVKYDVATKMAEYSNWYIILVACTQVRELSDSNLQNFSQMCGAKPLPARVKSFLLYWASTQDLLIDSEAARVRFISNKFFEYHTTGSSTPTLCEEAISEATGLGMFDDAEILVVQIAREAIHDLDAARTIPSRTLVKVRAVHDAAGTLPDIWYMGQKAVDRFSGKKYSAMVKMLKAIFVKQTNTEDLDERDLDTLTADLTSLINTF